MDSNVPSLKKINLYISFDLKFFSIVVKWNSCERFFLFLILISMGREEFKEQVKGILIDSIPENEEFESPEKMPNQTNKEVAHSKKSKYKKIFIHSLQFT